MAEGRIAAGRTSWCQCWLGERRKSQGGPSEAFAHKALAHLTETLQASPPKACGTPPTATRPAPDTLVTERAHRLDSLGAPSTSRLLFTVVVANRASLLGMLGFMATSTKLALHDANLGCGEWACGEGAQRIVTHPQCQIWPRVSPNNCVDGRTVWVHRPPLKQSPGRMSNSLSATLHP